MNTERIVVIIQARMSSTRLPGKVLKEIAGRPMLAWVVERARKAQTITDVIVATTTESSDDPIVGFCAEMGYACTRGSLNDVLDRFYQAARAHRAEAEPPHGTEQCGRAFSIGRLQEERGEAGVE